MVSLIRTQVWGCSFVIFCRTQTTLTSVVDLFPTWELWRLDRTLLSEVAPSLTIHGAFVGMEYCEKTLQVLSLQSQRCRRIQTLTSEQLPLS